MITFMSGSVIYVNIYSTVLCAFTGRLLFSLRHCSKRLRASRTSGSPVSGIHALGAVRPSRASESFGPA